MSYHKIQKIIQTPLISQNKYNFPKEKIHIAELELIAFLKQHPDICNDFKQISDSVCFKHKILLDKILEKKVMKIVILENLKVKIFEKI